MPNVFLLEPYDRIANWVSESPIQGDRYLWVLDHKTREISWKNREHYSIWQNEETARLQTIFEEMSAQLPGHLTASDQDQFQMLVELRGRISKSYEGFLQAHQSFFGMIYKFIFAFFLSDYYENLNNKLEQAISNSLMFLDLSALSADEIEKIASLIKEKRLFPSLKIDWAMLSLDQFKAAYKLEPYSLRISLNDLDQEKITFLFDLEENKINEFGAHEIQQNLANVEPRFMANLDAGRASALDLSKLSKDQLIEVLTNIELYYYTDLRFIDLAQFTSAEISSILENNPAILQKLRTKTVIINLSKIDVKYYRNLSDDQVGELDFSKLDGDQFMNLPPHYFLKDKQVRELNLGQFTALQISKILRFHEHLMGKLSPQGVADNLSKFEPGFLKSLSLKQVEALNFSNLTAEQLMNIPSYLISDKQWHKVDLNNYTTPTIAIMLERDPNLLGRLSPVTVAANLSRIATRYYRSLSDNHLKEIDYRTLNDIQKEAFSSYDMRKMKNSPIPETPKKPSYHHYGTGTWQRDYFSDFFGSSPFGGKPYNSNPFSGFGFGFDDDQWQQEYFKPFGSSQSQSNLDLEEKLKSYRSSLKSVVAKINSVNKVNSNAAYEKLRQKCLKRRTELENEPKLVFVDDLKDFNSDDIKSYYKKMAIVCHPDKNQSNLEEATELFKLISEAYKLLFDPQA